MTLVLVLVGGAAGAVLRYATDLWLRRRDPVLPWGTLIVNVAGSFFLGLLSGLSAGTLSPDAAALLRTGFCGALTTYSTFGLETVNLAKARAWRYASINVAATLIAGFAAVWLGWLVTG